MTNPETITGILEVTAKTELYGVPVEVWRRFSEYLASIRPGDAKSIEVVRWHTLFKEAVAQAAKGELPVDYSECRGEMYTPGGALVGLVRALLRFTTDQQAMLYVLSYLGLNMKCIELIFKYQFLDDLVLDATMCPSPSTYNLRQNRRRSEQSEPKRNRPVSFAQLSEADFDRIYEQALRELKKNLDSRK